MILTDYLRAKKDQAWDIARMSGVKHATIRLPEDEEFDITSAVHLSDVYKRYTDFGFTPIVIEPLPNALHDHIKSGDARRDEAIESFIRSFPILDKLNLRTVCFNWMAHIGWTRTRTDHPERGGALVTEFDLNNYEAGDAQITADELWANYEYFIKAVIPEAEKYGIKLALHPDDPPIPTLGKVNRIMVTKENIERAVFGTVKSDSLGLTMCQANFHLMGEEIPKVVNTFGKKIFFIHFRNVKGKPTHFHETFHDNGEIDMASALRCYTDAGIDVPIRVDHVPTMPDEVSNVPGYDAIGRFFAIGYLKGLLEATEIKGRGKNYEI